jgi:hypothetical protein
MKGPGVIKEFRNLRKPLGNISKYRPQRSSEIIRTLQFFLVPNLKAPQCQPTNRPVGVKHEGQTDRIGVVDFMPRKSRVIRCEGLQAIPHGQRDERTIWTHQEPDHVNLTAPAGALGTKIIGGAKSWSKHINAGIASRIIS